MSQVCTPPHAAQASLGKGEVFLLASRGQRPGSEPGGRNFPFEALRASQ